MKKNKINIDMGYEKLTEKDINDHKNFANIYANYHKMTQPLYKRPKFFGGFLIIAVVATIVLVETWQEEKGNSIQQQTAPIAIPLLKSIDTINNEVPIQIENITNELGKKSESKNPMNLINAKRYPIDFIRCLDSNIVSFDFVTSLNGNYVEEFSDNNCFTMAMKNIILLVPAETKIYLQNIKVKDKDGKIKRLPSKTILAKDITEHLFNKIDL